MQPSIYDYDDYRAFLRACLEEKARKNPAFSLRAFARDTGLSPSHLSRALSGQKKLSGSSAHLISANLELNSKESSYFQTLIELEKSKSFDKDGGSQNGTRLLKNLGREHKGKVKVLSLEMFQAVAHWYHFAILALTNTKGFQSNAGWIAQRLGIKALDARFAVDRLLDLGLLKEKNGAWTAENDAKLSTTDDFRSAAIQENHRQHLQLADKALENFPVELREFNNITLSMNLGDLPKAKKRIREFVEKFNEEMERNRGDEIFQLNVQFYPLSQQEKGQS